MGSVPSQTGLGYRLIDGTTTVAVGAGQLLLGSGTAALGTDGAEFLFRLDLCYSRTSPSVGSLTSFVAPADALLASVSDSTKFYTASPTVVPGAGTYTVGLCLNPIGGNLNDNDNGIANG